MGYTHEPPDPDLSEPVADAFNLLKHENPERREEGRILLQVLLPFAKVNEAPRA